MALTVREMANLGLLDTLAHVLRANGNADIVLANVGFDVTRRPGGTDNPLHFWREVCQLVEDGILPVDNGLERLVAAAAQLFPGNNRFAPYRRLGERPDRRLPPKPGIGANLGVHGAANLGAVMDAIRRVVAQMTSPPAIEPVLENDGMVVLHGADMDLEQARAFGDALTAELQQSGQQVQVAAATDGFREYLIGRLFVEGPDRARFELNNVPATTRVAEIAAGVMNEYDPQVWGQDEQGRTRHAVVDQVDANGATRRLRPDTTLNDNNTREGDTMRVAPESRAGVDAQRRDEALVRVRSQVVAFAERREGFDVVPNARHAPTEYLIRFRAPGIALSRGGVPMRVEAHEVLLQLPGSFPHKAPIAIWRTPIFHPNIDDKSGFVCLGELGDRYRPGMDFGDLCQILIDLACYRNYVVEHGLNGEAIAWAKGEPGQAAIAEIGGRVYDQNDCESLVRRPIKVNRCR